MQLVWLCILSGRPLEDSYMKLLHATLKRTCYGYTQSFSFQWWELKLVKHITVTWETMRVGLWNTSEGDIPYLDRTMQRYEVWRTTRANAFYIVLDLAYDVENLRAPESQSVYSHWCKLTEQQVGLYWLWIWALQENRSLIRDIFCTDQVNVELSIVLFTPLHLEICPHIAKLVQELPLAAST